MPADTAWDKKARELRPVLAARAARMLGGQSFGAGAPDVDDLVQVVLMKVQAQEAEKKFADDDLERVRRYALRTLHHTFVDLCTRKRREVLWSGDDEGPGEPVSEAESPEEELVAAETLARRASLLEKALADLDEQERDFLKLCYELGSAPAAQRKLGWPPGTAANACRRRNTLLRRAQEAATEAQTSKPTLKVVGG